MHRLVFLSFLSASLFLMSAGVGLAEDETTAILNKAIKAHGGEEKLAAIKAVKIQSRGTTPAKTEFNGQKKEEDLEYTRETVFLLPDNYKNVEVLNASTFGKLRTVNLLKKDKGTYSISGIVNESRNLTGGKLIDLRSDLHRLQVSLLPVYLRDKTFTLSSLPESKVGEKPAVGLKVKAKDCRDFDLFFDKASGLLVKISYQEVQNGKKVTVEREVTEHQKVGGVTVPKKIEMHHNGADAGDEEYVQVQLLPTVDEKEFEDKAANKAGAEGLPKAEGVAAKAIEKLGGQMGQMQGQPGLAVDLGDTQVTDADLKVLKDVKNLQFLRLVDCTQITDAGLKEVKNLKDLRTLFLGGTKVTDAGLKEVKELKKLQNLGLARTQVTDEGLKELKELKNLKQLVLQETKVTDAGVADLKKALPKLEVAH